MEKLLIPILAIIISFVFLFIDISKVNSIKTLLKSNQIKVILPLFFLYIYLVYVTIQENESQEAFQNEILKKVELGITAMVVNEASTLKGWGVMEPETKSIDQIMNIYSANSALKTYNLSSKNRQYMRVEYYRKDVDGEKVQEAFKELNYKYIVGKANLPDDQSNTIFVGEDVPERDIQIIALILIRAGVDLRSIQRVTYWPTEKRRIVQIGSSEITEGSPSIKVSQITNPKFLNEIITELEVKTEHLSHFNRFGQ